MTTRSTIRTAVLAALVLAWGCAAPASQLRTASTLQPGQIEVQAAVSLPIYTAGARSFADLAEEGFDQATKAEQADEELSQHDSRELYEAAIGIALFTPSPVVEFAARYGVMEHVDVGLRYASPKVEGDLRWQLVDGGLSEWDVAIDLAYAWHSGVGPSHFEAVWKLAEFVKLADFGRYDVSVAVLASTHSSDWFSIYLGARYIYSGISIGGVIEQVNSAAEALKSDLSSAMTSFVLTVGLEVGWKWLWVAAEFGIGAVDYEPTIVGAPVDLGGWMLAPAASLSLRF